MEEVTTRREFASHSNRTSAMRSG